MVEEKTPVPDEALEAVAGGANAKEVGNNRNGEACPRCGSINTMYEEFPDKAYWHCYDCQYDWDFD